MQTKTNKTDNKRGFDAVAASREWKAAVATATAAMSIAERMAWFRNHSSVPAIRSRATARGEKFQAHA